MNPKELIAEFWRVFGGPGPAGLLERYDEFFTEDFEWRPPIAAMRAAEYIGREGFARYVADLADAYLRIDATSLEISEISPQLFTARVRLHAEGEAGYSVDALLYAIVRFRDGRISYGFGSYDPHEAEKTVAAILEGEVPAR